MKNFRVKVPESRNYTSFNLLLVCPSVPTFVFAVLLMPSFKVLSDYFLCSLDLGGKFLLLEFWNHYPFLGKLFIHPSPKPTFCP